MMRILTILYVTLFMVIFTSDDVFSLESAQSTSALQFRPLPISTHIYSETIRSSDNSLLRNSVKAQISIKTFENVSIYTVGGIDSFGTSDRYLGMGFEFNPSIFSLSAEYRWLKLHKGSLLQQNRFLFTTGLWQERKINNLLGFFEIYEEAAVIQTQKIGVWSGNTFLPRLGLRQTLSSFWSIDELLEANWKVNQTLGKSLENKSEYRALMRTVYYRNQFSFSAAMGATINLISKPTPYALIVLDWKK